LKHTVTVIIDAHVLVLQTSLYTTSLRE